jgi:hypothetical protein
MEIVADRTLIKPDIDTLLQFRREDLRALAKELGVKRGRSTRDTAVNLFEDGRVRIAGKLAAVTN